MSDTLDDNDIKILTDFHTRVKLLIFNTPNDMDLGREVRKLKKEFGLISFAEKFRNLDLTKKPKPRFTDDYIQ